MNDIVTAVRAKLATTAGVTAITSTRIYFDQLPQDATLEAIVLELRDTDKQDRSTNGIGSMFKSYVNVILYAGTQAERYALAAAVHTALEKTSGTWGSTTVTLSLVEQQHDLTVPPRDGSEAFQLVRVLVCAIFHN